MKTMPLITIGIFLFTNVAQAAPLILESEAKLPTAAPFKLRSISRGPGIEVNSPDLTATAIRSPFDFKVIFKPHGGASIDVDTVKVIYLKTPIVNLSERIKASISEQGIDFSSAEVPVGKHSIQIILEDSDGRESSSIINLNVVK